MRHRKLILMIPLGIAAMLVFGFIGGQMVRLLWNWLMPPIFGWSPITFWQALGLLVLCRILVGGRGGGFARSQSRTSPEDQERWDRFRQRVRDRFCEKSPGAVAESNRNAPGFVSVNDREGLGTRHSADQNEEGS